LEDVETFENARMHDSTRLPRQAVQIAFGNSPGDHRHALERAGVILHWMIEGCRQWQENGGLQRPATVQAATEAYFSDQDLFGQWLEDCCDLRPGEPQIWDKSADLFDSWTDYAHKAGDSPGTKKSFGQAMQRRGLEPHRNQASRGFRFVRLKPTKGTMTHDAL
jgi:putative DNA primase/helicase